MHNSPKREKPSAAVQRPGHVRRESFVKKVLQDENARARWRLKCHPGRDFVSDSVAACPAQGAFPVKGGWIRARFAAAPWTP